MQVQGVACRTEQALSTPPACCMLRMNTCRASAVDLGMSVWLGDAGCALNGWQGKAEGWALHLGAHLLAGGDGHRRGGDGERAVRLVLCMPEGAQVRRLRASLQAIPVLGCSSMCITPAVHTALFLREHLWKDGFCKRQMASAMPGWEARPTCHFRHPFQSSAHLHMQKMPLLQPHGGSTPLPQRCFIYVKPSFYPQYGKLVTRADTWTCLGGRPGRRATAAGRRRRRHPSRPR